MAEQGAELGVDAALHGRREQAANEEEEAAEPGRGSRQGVTELKTTAASHTQTPLCPPRGWR